MSAFMDQLHDIETLDVISPWPLAIGWWIVIVVGFFLVGIGVWLTIKYVRYLRSWKRDTLKSLDRLEKNIASCHSLETITSLSEYLRRIAIKRFSRKACAGLVGIAWLEWLQAHDPKKFDWIEKGRPLIELPYAPASTNLPIEQLKELIQAVRHWVG